MPKAHSPNPRARESELRATARRVGVDDNFFEVGGIPSWSFGFWPGGPGTWWRSRASRISLSGAWPYTPWCDPTNGLRGARRRPGRERHALPATPGGSRQDLPSRRLPGAIGPVALERLAVDQGAGMHPRPFQRTAWRSAARSVMVPPSHGPVPFFSPDPLPLSQPTCPIPAP